MRLRFTDSSLHRMFNRELHTEFFGWSVWALELHLPLARQMWAARRPHLNEAPAETIFVKRMDYQGCPPHQSRHIAGGARLNCLRICLAAADLRFANSARMLANS